MRADGTFVYVPLRTTALAQGEQGTDQFTYTLQESNGQQSEVTLTYQNVGVNDAPAARADTNSAGAGQSAVASTRATGLLGNDTDPDNGETARLVISGVHAASSTAFAPVPAAGIQVSGTYGTLTVHPDGTYSYIADHAGPLAQGERGTDVFTYRVTDPEGATSDANVSFGVIGVNDTPTANPDLASALAGQTVTASLRSAGLLGNDTDPDSGETSSLAVTGVRVGSGSSTPFTAVTSSGVTITGTFGTLTLRPDGTYSYAADHAGALGVGDHAPDVFTYQITDAVGTTSLATLTFDVTGSSGFDGSFETGFTGWSRAGDTAVLAGGTTGAQEASITTSSTSSIPYSQIESFLGLPTGSLAADQSPTHPNNNSTVGSALQTTTLHLEAGQSLRFDWNFSTNDYAPYNDFAAFTIDELNAIFELADVESVGDFGSTGWRTFTFTARQSGDYHFGFAVLDTGDGSVASSLLIDNVHVVNEGAPIVLGPVVGSGTENSGTFTIDLLAGAADPDGTSLGIVGLDWHNAAGTSLPPGFALSSDGHTLVVDSTNPAFDDLGPGQSRIFEFDYDVVDASGARTTTRSRRTVQGSKQPGGLSPAQRPGAFKKQVA
ncbi:VCBS domain-containing protein [Micromonospora sp. STR1s_5]|nr:VCBS domain-containing protein [Micromonospora sp. STR1s_5]